MTPIEELSAERKVLWEAHSRARALVHELELEEEASPVVRELCRQARELRAGIERALLVDAMEAAA